MKYGKNNRVKIGSFTQDPHGFMHGKIFGLGLGVTPVRLDPKTSREGKSYFLIIADPNQGGYEIGLAFPRNKTGLSYHSVSIDSPMLSAPIHAALFQDREKDNYDLIWNRPELPKISHTDVGSGYFNVKPKYQPQLDENSQITG